MFLKTNTYCTFKLCFLSLFLDKVIIVVFFVVVFFQSNPCKSKVKPEADTSMRYFGTNIISIMFIGLKLILLQL